MQTLQSECRILKKSLLNLGFGESLNAELDQNASKKQEFTLNMQHEFNQRAVDYTLHFRAADNQDMYFFNKYDATIPHKDNPAKNVDQTFTLIKAAALLPKKFLI